MMQRFELLDARQRRRYVVLVGIVLATVPCYCAGWIAIQRAPDNRLLPSETASATPLIQPLTPTLASTSTPTITPTPTLTVTSFVPSPTFTPTSTATPTNSPTATETPQPTATQTATVAPTDTLAPTIAPPTPTP